MESVKAALRVLELVAENRGIGVSALSRMTGEPKTTVQRQLTTLHESDWIVPVMSGKRRKWVLGTKLPLIALKADRFSILRNVALPPMEALRDKTQETVHLTIREDNQIVLIERVDSPQTLRIVRAIGSTAPLHIAANGKAILAHLPPDELASYLSRELVSWTEKSVSNPEELRRNLDTVRELGYAFGDGELDLNVRTVAAAVLQADGSPIGAVSISCPASRLTDDLVHPYGGQVKAVAEQISHDYCAASEKSLHS